MRTRQVNRRSAMVFSALLPEKFDDAANAGTDIAVFDLEDGTAPGRKAEARETVAPVFEREGPFLQYLRINHPHSVDGLRDSIAVIEWQSPPDGLLLPKIESADEVRQIAATLCAVHPDIELVPIIESPSGLENVYEIANAAPQIVMLLLGSDDLSGSLGSDRSWEALAYARGRVAAAAGDASIEAMDGAFYDPDDEAGLIAELTRAAAMGFSGKASYHAGQIPHIHAAFTPEADAVAEAKRILEAAAADSVGSARLDGRMINAAIVKRAKRLLAIAERRGVDR
ncbi:MAG: CoA ester lyase [Alphaproteobacteria bacterium]|nr:CoA ester lyase [Alphaproteobacteria bacterium]